MYSSYVFDTLRKVNRSPLFAPDSEGRNLGKEKKILGEKELMAM